MPSGHAFEEFFTANQNGDQVFGGCFCGARKLIVLTLPLKPLELMGLEPK
jgi:hypothetical protein